MSRPIWVVVAMALVLASCGSRVREDPFAAASDGLSAADVQGTQVEAPSTSAPPSTGGDGGGPAEVEGAGAASNRAPANSPAADPEATAPVDQARTPEPPSSSGAVEVLVEPSCVEAPGTVDVVVNTYPFADIAYGVAYSDGQNHDAYGIGQANKDGRFQTPVAVPPTAARGEAKVLVAARQIERGGGSAEATFIVADPKEC